MYTARLLTVVGDVHPPHLVTPPVPLYAGIHTPCPISFWDTPFPREQIDRQV